MKVSAEFAIAAAGLGVLAFVLYRSSSAVSGAVSSAVGAVSSTVGSVVAAINPANPDNVVASGVNAAGQMASGDSSWTVGGAAFDATHDAQGQPLGYMDWVRRFWGFESAPAPVTGIDFGYGRDW